MTENVLIAFITMDALVFAKQKYIKRFIINEKGGSKMCLKSSDYG